MKKLSVQSLNALFSQLNEQPASVLWIRSKDYERQLYVNSNYERIWARKTEELYKDPRSFQQTIHAPDLTELLSNVDGNITGKVQDHTMHYRIILPTGEYRFIKDWHYLLTDEQGNLTGFAGVAQAITEQEWEAEQHLKVHAKTQQSQDMLTKYIFDILHNELHLNASPKQNENKQYAKNGPAIRLVNKGQSVELTPREVECLALLLAGKSAKQTAAIMNISTRTVEFHLENIKSKASCRTKLELLSKVEKETDN